MSDPSRELIGGRYQILTTLGRGGMGLVFKAYDPILDRDVAIKKMATSLVDNDEHRRRFQTEARAAARLNHPNIVTIYELEEYRGDFYIVMELLEGLSLAAYMQRRPPLPLDAQLTILAQVCDALDFAHVRSIVHRDIKPANLILMPSGIVKILDFGIAQLASSDLTRKGALLGTPNYMSPEQVKGDAVDARADLFSAGAVAYEMAAGTKAFSADSMAMLLMKISEASYPPLSDVAPQTPPALVTLIARMLSKNRDLRPARGNEVRQALEHIGSIDRLDLVGAAVTEALTPSEGDTLVQLPAAGERPSPSPPVAARSLLSTHRSGATTPPPVANANDPLQASSAAAPAPATPAAAASAGEPVRTANLGPPDVAPPALPASASAPPAAPHSSAGAPGAPQPAAASASDDADATSVIALPPLPASGVAKPATPRPSASADAAAAALRVPAASGPGPASSAAPAAQPDAAAIAGAGSSSSAVPPLPPNVAGSPAGVPAASPAAQVGAAVPAARRAGSGTAIIVIGVFAALVAIFVGASWLWWERLRSSIKLPTYSASHEAPAQQPEAASTANSATPTTTAATPAESSDAATTGAEPKPSESTADTAGTATPTAGQPAGQPAGSESPSAASTPSSSVATPSITSSAPTNANARPIETASPTQPLVTRASREPAPPVDAIQPPPPPKQSPSNANASPTPTERASATDPKPDEVASSVPSAPSPTSAPDTREPESPRAVRSTQRPRTAVDSETVSAFQKSGDAAALLGGDQTMNAAAVVRIKDTLERYGRAFEEHDIDTLHALRDSLSPAEQNLLDGPPATVRFADIDVAVDATRATVHARRSIAITGRPAQTTPIDMQLIRRPSGWVITTISH